MSVYDYDWSIFDDKKEEIEVNENMCDTCNIEFVTEPKRSIKVCTNCGYCKRVKCYKNSNNEWEHHKKRNNDSYYNKSDIIFKKLKQIKGLDINDANYVVLLFDRNVKYIHKIYRSQGRINLNYDYIMHKLLEYANFSEYVEPLKETATNKKMDKIWELIEPRLKSDFLGVSI